MSKHYQRGDELIPGYQLTSYLGRGGFGEVWKAAGPGGIEVAMKTIHDLDRKKGGRELKALRLLKNIRHPNLVPLTGFWLRAANGELLSDDETTAVEQESGEEITSHDDPVRGTMVAENEAVATLATTAEAVELIIAMGLCESSLTDRLEQCRADGQRGLPFEELLTYMEDTARAIDLLNNKHDIQHCDIKPQNILLLSGAAQVADFGLAKMIGDIRESSMGAGTIAYGAPEVLMGAGPSSATDQYSLAISYFELRTGHLPFGSDRISEVLAAKQEGTIDLTVLPRGEREVLARATALKPEDRFTSCSELVHALRKHGSATAKLAKYHDTVSRSHDNTVSIPPAVQSRWWKSPAGLVSMGAAVAITAVLLLMSDNPSPAVAPENALAAAASSTANSDMAQDTGEATAVRKEDLTEASVGHENRTPVGHSPDAETERRMAAATERTAEAVEELSHTSAETAENTRRLAEMAEQTAAAEQQLADTAAEISRSLDGIREQLARAADHGGLIAEPREPSDFYHNARMYQSRGDYRNARRSYSRLLAFQLNALDPHLEFQRILRIQDGHAAVRDVYADLPFKEENLAAQFSRILAEPKRIRRERLLEFVDAHPDYAPGLYFLGVEFSEDKLGAQGLADMAREKELLEQFQELVGRGKLLEHFLDQSHAISMVESVERRLAALKPFDEAAFRNPVQLTGMVSSTSWSVNLTVSEAAREISYRLKQAEPFQPTGFHSFVDQRTGSPAPRTNVQLPLQQEKTTLWVKYVDIRGSERGPFELVFDPQTERIRSGKQILTQLPHAWISFRLYDNSILAYFSHLQSYRYALREIRYSIDADTLDQSFPLGEFDQSHPGVISANTKTYITIPNETQFLSVQLTFGDGSKSQLRRFKYDGERPTGYQTQAAAPMQTYQTVPSDGTPSGGRVSSPIDRLDVNIDPTFRSAPRVRFGF